MIIKLILRMVFIMISILWWIAFPAGLLGILLVERRITSLRYQWDSFWRALTFLWQGEVIW